MTRTFTWKQRAALFQLAGGRCEHCGTPLAHGWHADHKHPWSKGGMTDVANGQALCPTCNLKKGARSMHRLEPWSLDLRRWQSEAGVKFRNSNNPNFMMVATPGAGKTRFTLSVAHDLLITKRVSYLIVVVPTSHLKFQWSEAATKVGIHLDPRWSNQLNGMIGGDYHGVVVTYQQVASNPEIFRAFCARATTFAVFDEIHHAGDENSWGTALQHAFSYAQRRLLLSGTPFRSDGNPIPFVTYENGRSKADDTYGYADALSDDPQVCRYIWFPSFEGRMDWISGGDYYSATFSDVIEEQRQSERLRAAIDAESDWLKTVILEADRKLHDMRLDGHPTAGGLVIARDQWHARDVQRLVQKVTGYRPMLAISDDPEASSTIATFAAGSDRWLVAVKMVSEGVDIPRLRVGIYATNVISELFFRQAVGRFVRWDDTLKTDQDAYIYIPADIRLINLAAQIMQERDYQTAEAIKKLEREIKDRATPGDDTRGLFTPISVTDVHPDAVVTGNTVLTPHHIAYAQEVMNESGVHIPVELAAKMLYVAGAFGSMEPPKEPPTGTTAGDAPERQPMHAILKKVKSQVHKRVHQLHVATNEMLNHGEIWAKLKATDGMEHHTATLDQHMERLKVLDRWITEVRHAR